MEQFDESKHPRDADGKFTDGKSDFDRAAEKHFPHLTEREKGDKISGAITGAAAIDPESKEGNDKAEILYSIIRKSDLDVGEITATLKAIAPELEISAYEIEKIKRYLFIDKHNLLDGYHKFYENADIADSWRRLQSGGKHVLPHDITLIRHERLEMMLVEGGMPQGEAHRIAEQKHNYHDESRRYHSGKARKHKTRRRYNFM